MERGFPKVVVGNNAVNFEEMKSKKPLNWNMVLFKKENKIMQN